MKTFIVIVLSFALMGCAALKSAEDKVAARAVQFIDKYCALSEEERVVAREKIDEVLAPYVLRLDTCEPETVE
jgi:hypothetical protein